MIAHKKYPQTVYVIYTKFSVLCALDVGIPYFPDPMMRIPTHMTGY